MVKSPSETPPSSPPPPRSPSPPPSPNPRPRKSVCGSQSVTDILASMCKPLPRPISPLHSSYLELPPPPSPPPSSPASSQQLPPQKSLAEDLPRPISPPSANVQPTPPPSPPPSSPASSQQLPPQKSLAEDLPRPISPPSANVQPQPPPSIAVQPPPLPPENWSPEEESLFQQGTEACGNDWEAISADYVKTKTPIQISEYAKKNKTT